MSYRSKKYLNASFLKEIIDSDLTLDLLNEKWNIKKEGRALIDGTKIHSYLLEGEENEFSKKLADLKPFIDCVKGFREKEIYSTLEGVKCKSKIDILTKDTVYDLKTASSIEGIKERIEMFGYDLQMAFYELISGVDNSVLIFVTKKAKKNILVYYPMPDLYLQKEKILDFIAINKELFNQFFTGK